MESEINFKIKNVGPVANANIDIGKINVVGGKNSTGKSTSSKILYCFLRANSSNRQDLAIGSLFSEIRRFDMLLGRYLPEENLESLRMSRREVNKYNFDDLVRYYQEMKSTFYETYEFGFAYLEEERRIGVKDGRELGKLSYKDNNTFSRRDRLMRERELRDNKTIYRQINTIERLIPIIESNSNELYESTMETLISSEFINNPIRGMRRYRVNGFSSISSKDLDFEYSVDFLRHKFDYTGIFSIEDVYYLDSYSLFDLGMFRPMGPSRNTAEHVTRLYSSI